MLVLILLCSEILFPDFLQVKKPYMQEISKGRSAFHNEQGLQVPSQSRDSITGGHKSTIAKICEEGKFLGFFLHCCG